MNARPLYPTRFPSRTFLGFVMAWIAGAGLVKLWLHCARPTQAHYLGQYVYSYYYDKIPHLSLRLTPRDRFVTSAKRRVFANDLKALVYENKPPLRLLLWPEIGFGFCLVCSLAIGSTFDRKQNELAREGVQLTIHDGPRLATWRQFNAAINVGEDGLRIALAPNIIERLLGQQKYLQLRADKEAHHAQIDGVTGTGKSTIIREWLYQLEERGYPAVVFDPEGDYTSEFYNERRGDWILDPKDQRCAVWDIGREADDEVEATPIALGLIPDRPGSNENQFFKIHPRAILAYLLTLEICKVCGPFKKCKECMPARVTTDLLAYWCANEKIIDRLVKGTEHAVTITQNSPQQRAGILGALNEIAKPLRTMPTTGRVWTAREWSRTRKGWVFIKSNAKTLDAVRPLNSLWLDLLILNLQAIENDGSLPPVTTILDELHSLQMLPQLHHALTKNRKSGNPIVMGYQGMSQIRSTYGNDIATAITSQPYTNIVLREKEWDAAEHHSKLIGEVEVERVTENQPATTGPGRTKSYTTHRVWKRLVPTSTIQTLPDLQGYLAYENLVVRIKLAPRPKRLQAPKQIERKLPAFTSAVIDIQAQDAESESPKPGAPAKATDVAPVPAKATQPPPDKPLTLF